MDNRLEISINFRSVIGYALPSIAMMVFMSVYTIIDSLFVANLVNTDALAAINIIYPAYCLMMATGAMLATGGSAIVAREMGKGRVHRTRRIFSMIVATGVATSLIFTLLGLLFARPLLGLLGAEAEIYGYCYAYFVPLLFFSPTIMLQMLFEVFFVTAGHPGRGMWLIVAAGITNAILDYVFIALMGMGIGGAAWATGIGTAIPAIWGLAFFFGKKSALNFARPYFSFKVLGEASFNGSSEMVTYLATAFSTLLFNWMALKLLGVDGVAAVAILLYAEFLLNAVFYGFAYGIAPVISYYHGLGDKAKLRGLIRLSLGFVVGFSLVIFALANLAAGTIVAFFAPAGSPVHGIALTGFKLFSLSFIFAGFNIFASAMFTALSNGLVSASIAFCRTFLFIGSGILLLPLFFASLGLWIAMPVAETLSMAVAAAFILREFRGRLQD